MAPGSEEVVSSPALDFSEIKKPLSDNITFLHSSQNTIYHHALLAWTDSVLVVSFPGDLHAAIRRWTGGNGLGMSLVHWTVILGMSLVHLTVILGMSLVHWTVILGMSLVHWTVILGMSLVHWTVIL